MQKKATQLTGLNAQTRAVFGLRFKQYCLSSVSALAMSLYPLQAVSQTAAQDKILFDKYDTRVDVAAAYTEVMYQVQRNLARYLSGTAGGVHEGLRLGIASRRKPTLMRSQLRLSKPNNRQRLEQPMRCAHFPMRCLDRLTLRFATAVETY